ncbi:uS10/mL48 family ribosomal protein [Haloarchaeobius sp. HME9146]|uniref:uS10/mL48 family ribosomal protein n=1 Tax=Haloarchaeobius sp. HME9146 TaxID=2978732 RepID=UPI0021BE981F|nr:uS10/mL48 family ribosomal protein [Haloarchaeobius sp. HME9146]MCT9095902.1 uS10/mL48 family ribosomal protein [Haloarchaeobius sp. HME9146]
MSFVTRLTLQSGDRAVLDSVVDDIRATVSRKGAEMKGPHSAPPEHLRVPQHRTLSDDETAPFDHWNYTVYSREIEIVGHDEVARLVAGQDMPPSVHVEVEVEQIRSMGS